MTQPLLGKIAYVTGGSRGIGRACAIAFADAGADIAICHLNDEAEAKTLVQAVTARGRRGFQMPADMGVVAEVNAFAAAAEAALGPCDILLNNAGMNIRGPFGEIAEADFDRMMSVHMKGMFFMAQAVYPGMVARGAGRIINMASQLALKGSPGIVTYCAAKAGIIGFTRALAHEAGPKGVLVNAIAPGPIETDLTRSRGPEWKARIAATLPLGRLGQPEEIAATALLLAGQGGTYYAGACLSPNGGDVMH
ncbi:SDR family oxidoreductase [Sediminicoccus sp. KRV36]|uniref:SDR family NAD(P)-dependent oxidoreductase n=1 Tax=Sediminicoccus sp. KRV36 TaxID=3133721 RepID=UPI00200DD268|nr:SDR family oxidoreductase [Sediminicoccus rosea]UPY39028.1 SDR family oxidoreductase [Sediminicoccus rosea]